MARPVGYGRPGTHVFPLAWSETNAAVETTTYESMIIIAPAATGPQWDPALHQTRTTAPAAAYDGPASLRPPTRDGLDLAQQNVAEDLVRNFELEVCLPMPTDGIAEHMTITIVSSPDDTLAGRTATVTYVEHGDRRFTRLLGATLNP
jgi:hypothetical protein